MADTNFARRIKKHAGRASEMLRQNIGKADKTTDEDFEDFVKNFNKQLGSSVRLNKEVKNYYNCLKALEMASKGLMDVVFDLYEPNWIECDKVQVKATMLEKKWHNYIERMNEQVIGPLAAYVEQFQDVNNKIMKRKKKLLDYDFCRHSIQNLEQSTKKREEKLTKARVDLAEKQNVYETINSELLIELPALYDSRVSFLASNMQSLFVAEASFHGGIAKIFGELNDTVEALAMTNQTGIYSTRRTSMRKSDYPNATLQVASDKMDAKDRKGHSSKSSGLPPGDAIDYSLESSSTATSKSSIQDYEDCVSTLPLEMTSDKGSSSETSKSSSSVYNTCESSSLASDTESAGSMESVVLLQKMDKRNSEAAGKKKQNAETSIEVARAAYEPDEPFEDIIPLTEIPQDIQSSEVKGDEPKPGKPVKYQVEATYAYVAEDGDELSFETGEIINVIDIDDPEQQEDGWLYGYKGPSDIPGLFPANFTKPV